MWRRGRSIAAPGNSPQTPGLVRGLLREEKSVDRVRRIQQHRCQDVLVAHRQADVRVARDLHNHSIRNTLGEQVGRRAMPQIVEVDSRNARCHSVLFEPAKNVSLIERHPNIRHEDEFRFFPPRTNSEPVLLLADSLLSKHRGHQLRERKRTPIKSSQMRRKMGFFAGRTAAPSTALLDELRPIDVAIAARSGSASISED
jgi:hypothetical protein